RTWDRNRSSRIGTRSQAAFGERCLSWFYSDPSVDIIADDCAGSRSMVRYIGPAPSVATIHQVKRPARLITLYVTCSPSATVNSTVFLTQVLSNRSWYWPGSTTRVAVSPYIKTAKGSPSSSRMTWRCCTSAGELRLTVRRDSIAYCSRNEASGVNMCLVTVQHNDSIVLIQDS